MPGMFSRHFGFKLWAAESNIKSGLNTSVAWPPWYVMLRSTSCKHMLTILIYYVYTNRLIAIIHPS